MYGKKYTTLRIKPDSKEIAIQGMYSKADTRKAIVKTKHKNSHKRYAQVRIWKRSLEGRVTAACFKSIEPNESTVNNNTKINCIMPTNKIVKKQRKPALL